MSSDSSVKPRRALALDALRGFAILTMVLSGVLPWVSLELTPEQVVDWPRLCSVLSARGPLEGASPSRRIWELLAPETREKIKAIAEGNGGDGPAREDLAEQLNAILRNRDFYRAEDFTGSVVHGDGITALQHVVG